MSLAFDDLGAAVCADCGFDDCLCEVSTAMSKPHEFPRYSLTKYDKAGKLSSVMPQPGQASVRDWVEAVTIVANWRAAHGYPLSRIREWLRRKALKVDPKANVAQRLKRLTSIRNKLDRPGRKWRLTQLQDIAGCRAIVKSNAHIQLLTHRLRSKRVQHELVKVYDYITSPQATGYRSLHLVYSFCSSRHPSFEGLLCEIQLRTPAQHAWATAVEVAGFFKGQDLKGGIGDADWLRFFALASGAIALQEKAQPVPGVPETRAELLAELADYARKTDVISWMEGFHFAPSIARQRRKRDAFWYLLTLNIETRRVQWDDFTMAETEEAYQKYGQAEAKALDNPSLQVVLVSADGLRDLRTAYPAFFADTVGFRRVIATLLGAEHR